MGENFFQPVSPVYHGLSRFTPVNTAFSTGLNRAKRLARPASHRLATGSGSSRRRWSAPIDGQTPRAPCLGGRAPALQLSKIIPAQSCAKILPLPFLSRSQPSTLISQLIRVFPPSFRLLTAQRLQLTFLGHPPAQPTTNAQNFILNFRIVKSLAKIPAESGTGLHRISAEGPLRLWEDEP